MENSENTSPWRSTTNLYLLLLFEIAATVLIALAVLLVLIEISAEDLSVEAYIGPIVLFPVITGIILAAFGLYDSRRIIITWDVLRRFALAWLVVVGLVALIAVVLKANYAFSRSWFLATVATAFVCNLFWRWLLNRRILKDLEAVAAKTNVLAIGAGGNHRRAIERLEQQSRFSYQSITTVEWREQDANADVLLQELSELERDKQFTQIWIVGAIHSRGVIERIVQHYESNVVQINFFPNFDFLPVVAPQLHTVSGLPAISLTARPLRSTDRWIKTLFDKVFSTTVLLLLSPLIALIALGVKLSSPGPVFYRQERLTLSGRSFEMIKFRSMPVVAEDHTGPVWAQKGENRATKFGAFLRKTSLDELPQFFNVLAGDMSVVGPRPERPFFVEQFQHTVPAYMQKHQVKAGITGWAQINGFRGNTSIDERIAHDLHYIQNWSFWLDIKIILMTMVKGFVSESAY